MLDMDSIADFCQIWGRKHRGAQNDAKEASPCAPRCFNGLCLLGRLLDGYIGIRLHAIPVQVLDDKADGVVTGRGVEDVISPQVIAEGQRAAFLIGLVHQLTVCIQVVPQLQNLSLIHISPIADRLKRGPATIANGYDEVTVLFADIVNFTSLSADADPVDVVSFLNGLFSQFDDLAAGHGLEKIKTIGDAYMVAGGLPTPRPDHCEAVIAFGLDVLRIVERCKAWHGAPVCMRIGVNTCLLYTSRCV